MDVGGEGFCSCKPGGGKQRCGDDGGDDAATILSEDGDAAGQNGGHAHVGLQGGQRSLGIANIVDAALGTELQTFGFEGLAQVVDVQDSELVARGGFAEAGGDFVGRAGGVLAVDHGTPPSRFYVHARGGNGSRVEVILIREWMG